MAAWPTEETVELALPSGAKMCARLPDETLLEVWGVAIELRREERGERSADISDARADDIRHAMGAVLMYVCMKPRLSLEPRGPEEIHPDQMLFEDAIFIIKWALRGARQAGAKAHPHKTKFRHTWRRKRD